MLTTNKASSSTRLLLVLLLCMIATTVVTGFAPLPTFFKNHDKAIPQLSLFNKMFEESGPLGKGITVGKVQVSLSCSSDRSSSSSIFGILQKASSKGSGSNNPQALASLANEVCLALLRKNSDWMGACSTSEWFGQNDASKAESLFNEWTNKEASKFEKEYVPTSSTTEKEGPLTLAVVSIVVELQGDSTTFDGAGYSIEGTRQVLNSIASDVTVDRGECLNAVEVFWTPSDETEVLTSQDVVLDFPELIDL